MPSLKVNSAFSCHPGGERLGQGHGIAAGIGHRGNALQPLQRLLYLGSLGCPGRQLVLEHPVTAARAPNHLAQLEVLGDGELGKGADDGAGRAFELVR